MKPRTAWVIGCATITMLAASKCVGAAGSATPDAEAIARAGEATLERLSRDAARWVARCQLSGGDEILITVTKHGDRRLDVFEHRKGEKRTPLLKILDDGETWWSTASGKTHKTNPFQATLPLPAAYYYRSLAEILVIVDPSKLEHVEFRSREGDSLRYVMPVDEAERNLLTKAIAALEAATGESEGRRLEIAKQIELARRRLAEGTPLRVSARTGMIVETQVESVRVVIDDFIWVSDLPADQFKPPETVNVDQTKPWEDSNAWLLVHHDPWAKRETPTPSLEGFLLNAATGEIRRLPYQGANAVPLCFLQSRDEVLALSNDPLEGKGLVQIDLTTGENTPIPRDDAMGIPMAAAAAPNGRDVALLCGWSGQGELQHLRFYVLNLETEKITPMGESGRLGGPFSWLPDGSGLIVKRFLPVRDPNKIEDRVICRLDRDGTLTDIMPGDTPVVLRKTGRILFQKQREWHTARFDGSGVERYADGMKGHGAPAISPDEQEIAFMRYDPDGLPTLRLFKLGQTEGRTATSAPGMVVSPIWR